jgi:hypothetical protein
VAPFVVRDAGNTLLGADQYESRESAQQARTGKEV